MYRISRILETSCVAILKLAGQVTDLEVVGWADFLKELAAETGHFIVLDFCDICRVDRKPAELLVRNLPEHVLLLNCPTGIKNMVDSAGLRRQVLEPSADQNPCGPARRAWNKSAPGGVV